ncbi:DUF535 family protein [Methylomonas sp. AM2-LC]|uniref:DUF535 family protein n=1 Tax=Methylomonas sp. AM2-LC TaxID=3153301 RepID=UPI0032676D19
MLKKLYHESIALFPENRFIYFVQRWIFVLYCLPVFPRVSLWLQAVDNPILFRELAQRPKIREFIYRPYLNRYWTLEERLSAIENHYRLIAKNIPFLDLASVECMELAYFKESDGVLRVIIDRPEWMRREGELGLSFFWGIDRIYTVMFIFAGDAANMKILVGNIQGDCRDRANVYKKLTKNFHGMRPRDFLIQVLKIVGGILNRNEILGVSDKAHRNSHWFSRAKKIAIYDSMWQEQNGFRNKSGFFSMGTGIEKRNERDIPARKRALYRRRYQFLEAMQIQLTEVIRSDPTPPKMHIDEMHTGFLTGKYD